MKKVVIVAITGFFIMTGIPAYTEGPYELFISTDPVEADVFINGAEAGKTPMRLRNFTQDSVELQIKKNSYVDVKEEITLSGERRELIFYALAPENLQITFHQKDQNIYINDEPAGKTPLSIGNLPSGTYRIEKTDDGIAFSNEMYKYLKRATLTETLFTAGIMGLSAAGAIIYSRRGSHEPQTYVLGISSAVFGGLFGYNLLKLSKINTIHRKEVEGLEAINVETFRRETARDLFSTGMEMLGNENYDEALTKFSFVVNVFSDSEYAAISMYEIGYCYYMKENYDKATEYFRRFVYEYPIYELFNYGAYYLLDIALESGQFERALADYNNLRPIYLEDETGSLQIEFYRVLTGLYDKTGSSHDYILSDLLAELDYFLENMKDSSAYPDIYLRKGKLLFEHLQRDEGERILNDIKEKYNFDKNLTREADIILNG
jgi:tetratricopeptide (TPR) repeat protein